MSAVQETERQVNISQMGLLDRFLRTPVVKDTIKYTTKYLVDSGTRMIKVKGRKNLELLDDMLTPQTLLLVASGHQNHADALIPMIMADEIREYVNGIQAPISITLQGRQQGRLLGAFYNEGVVPIFDALKIAPIYVATENDVKKRGAKRTDPREIVAQILSDVSRASFFFPEGSVEPGRPSQQFENTIENELLRRALTAKNPVSKAALTSLRWLAAFSPSEDIKGVQQIENPSFFYFLSEAAQKAGIDIVVLPIAPHGTFRMLREKPTLVSTSGFFSLIRQRVFGMDETLAELNIGVPFKLDSTTGRKGAREQAEKLSDSVMSRIADLLPEEAKGHFKAKTV